VQGYNSQPGPQPLNRSELYPLWYWQSLFDGRIVFRIGKQVPTFDFDNVAAPSLRRMTCCPFPTSPVCFTRRSTHRKGGCE
jgi:carbohydrate-selective porin OprB